MRNLKDLLEAIAGIGVLIIFVLSLTVFPYKLHEHYNPDNILWTCLLLGPYFSIVGGFWLWLYFYFDNYTIKTHESKKENKPIEVTHTSLKVEQKPVQPAIQQNRFENIDA